MNLNQTIFSKEYGHISFEFQESDERIPRSFVIGFWQSQKIPWKSVIFFGSFLLDKQKK